jgi:hypothetical protein
LVLKAADIDQELLQKVMLVFANFGNVETVEILEFLKRNIDAVAKYEVIQPSHLQKLAGFIVAPTVVVRIKATGFMDTLLSKVRIDRR